MAVLLRQFHRPARLGVLIRPAAGDEERRCLRVVALQPFLGEPRPVGAITTILRRDRRVVTGVTQDERLAPIRRGIDDVQDRHILIEDILRGRGPALDPRAAAIVREAGRCSPRK